MLATCSLTNGTSLEKPLENIHLGTDGKVNAIITLYSNDTAKYTTAILKTNAEVVYADFVIVTVPLGVLKEQSIAFLRQNIDNPNSYEPALSNDMLGVFQRTGM